MRVGSNFNKLWAASTSSNLGDGVYAAALPLLASTVTRDSTSVALVGAAGALPWLFLGPVSGVLVDRWDRWRTMVLVDLMRFAVVAMVAVSVLVSIVSIPILMSCAFLLGIGQTFFETASQSVLPELVGRDQNDLERANGRLATVQILAEQFLGPPLGGLLYGIQATIPIALNSVSFGASSGLLATVRRSGPDKAGRNSVTPTTVWADLMEGLRWLWQNHFLRTLAVVVGGTNACFTAGEAVLVLFAQDELNLTNVQYGVLLTALAAGAFLGGLVAARISASMGPFGTFVTTLLTLAASRLLLGMSHNPWSAAASLVAAGFAMTVFNVIAVSIRQRLVPTELMGRVVAAYRLIAFGSVPVGSIIGGLVGKQFGLAAPMLLGGAGIALCSLILGWTARNASLWASIKGVGGAFPNTTTQEDGNDGTG